VCGFAIGDKVAMKSALVRQGAPSRPIVRRGRVVKWSSSCGHIIEWGDELGAPVTALPNPNVRLLMSKDGVG
jgi:hypothetical protein